DNHPYVEDVNLDGTPLVATTNTPSNAPSGIAAFILLFGITVATIVYWKRKRGRIDSVAVFGVNVEERFQKF
ncbi:31_t:CDS:2, partial [Racocetra persica]